jgi:hypothetical protein
MSHSETILLPSLRYFIQYTVQFELEVPPSTSSTAIIICDTALAFINKTFWQHAWTRHTVQPWTHLRFNDTQ